MDKNVRTWFPKRIIKELNQKTRRTSSLGPLNTPGWPSGLGGGLQTRCTWVQIPSPASKDESQA
jgi:hypothetical protein